MSQLSGYDKTPWARESLGSFKNVFSSLQPTQLALLNSSLKRVFCYRHSLLCILVSFCICFASAFYSYAERLENGFDTSAFAIRTAARYISISCQLKKKPKDFKTFRPQKGTRNCVVPPPRTERYLVKKVKKAARNRLLLLEKMCSNTYEMDTALKVPQHRECVKLRIRPRTFQWFRSL